MSIIRAGRTAVISLALAGTLGVLGACSDDPHMTRTTTTEETTSAVPAPTVGTTTTTTTQETHP